MEGFRSKGLGLSKKNLVCLSVLSALVVEKGI